MPTKELEASTNGKVAPGAYKAQKFEHLLGLEGFSDKLLENHFKLYEGYVTNTNKLLEKLAELTKKGEAETPIYGEIKRRLGWEWNGMRLHEYYFSNLTKKKNSEPSGVLTGLFDSQFGGFENWRKDFVATGAMRGIGWAILYRDPQSNRLINSWIEEHATNHLAGGDPILIMDVYEHAFMLDYGTDRVKYIESFFKGIDWTVVSERLKKR